MPDFIKVKQSIKSILNDQFSECHSDKLIRIKAVLKKSPRIQSKKKHNIKKISDTTRYRCSDSSLVSQAEITANYRKVQEHIALESTGVCQGTGRTDLPLSFSHTISRARCKQLGKAELIWDIDNIEIESMGTNDSAHYIWEHGDLESKKTLLNFTRKLEYIRKHDPETYNKMIWQH